MRAERANNINFQGKLVITNHLSNKPNNCINKVRNRLECLVQEKDCDLYITQDYSKNKICISTKYPATMLNSTWENIPVNAKSSRYFDKAKNVIDLFEKDLYNKTQKEWEIKQKHKRKENVMEILELIALSPLLIMDGIIHSVNPKWSEKFEKIIDRI